MDEIFWNEATKNPKGRFVTPLDTIGMLNAYCGDIQFRSLRMSQAISYGPIFQRIPPDHLIRSYLKRAVSRQPWEIGQDASYVPKGKILPTYLSWLSSYFMPLFFLREYSTYGLSGPKSPVSLHSTPGPALREGAIYPARWSAFKYHRAIPLFTPAKSIRSCKLKEPSLLNLFLATYQSRSWIVPSFLRGAIRVVSFLRSMTR